MLFIVLLPFTILTLICTQFFVENVLEPKKISADFQSVLYAIIGLGSLLYSLGRLGESVVSGNTIIVTMVQVANSFCTALAVTTKNLVQD